jgi:hypothetical protein
LILVAFLIFLYIFVLNKYFNKPIKMKNNLLKGLVFASALTLSLGACKKESTTTDGDGNGNGNAIEVPRVAHSVVNKVTGTLCPPCGGWGWDAFEELISTNKGKAYFVGTYSQNFVAKELITQIASDWDDYWGITGYPTFCANFAPQLSRTSSGVNITAEKKLCNDAVTAHVGKSPLANTAFTVTWTEEAGWYKVSVATNTKFFEATTGTYHLGVYIIEDKVKAGQAGHTPSTNVPHHYVLKQSMDEITNKSFGDVVAEGDIAANKVVSKTYTTYLPLTTVKENVSILTMINKKNGTKWEFVNAYSDQK